MTLILIAVVTAAAILAPDALTQPEVLVVVAVGTFLFGVAQIADAIEGRRIEYGKRRLLRAVERVK